MGLGRRVFAGLVGANIQRVQPDAYDGPYRMEVAEPLYLKITNWHAEHRGEPLTLTASEVGELAGCACCGDEA